MTGTEIEPVKSPAKAFVISREFKAPKKLVYEAWTEPARLEQWWGPKGFTVRVVKLELQSGGIFHYAMRTPDGNEMFGKFVYRGVQPEMQLAFVVSFADADANAVRHPMAPDWPLELLSIVTFAERAGRTTLNLRAVPVNPTPAEEAAFAAGQESLNKGWTGTLDQLEAHLSRTENVPRV